MEKILLDNYNGKDSFLYVIKNSCLELGVVDFGCRIHSIKVDGVDICLGYNKTSEYLKSGTYMGATIGRHGNRIKDGRFSLNGVTYQLNINNGKNHNHGGFVGFDRVFFDFVRAEEDSLLFHYFSKDKEENYPGDLDLFVKYTIKDMSVLIEFSAKSDQDTIWNPTNHTYFNLDGEDEPTMLNNILQINASGFTPTDETQIPLGNIQSVVGTPFDFRSGKTIGQDNNDPYLIPTKGYDHNFVLDGNPAAVVKSNKTGISMKIESDMPCLQFYGGGLIIETEGKSRRYGQYAGFCLEPHHCPNAINMEGFKKPILKKDELGSHYIKYIFEK